MTAESSVENQGSQDSRTNRKLERLLVYGYYGQRNTGDDAMLYAFLLQFASKPVEFMITCGEERPAIPENAERKVVFVKTSPFAILTSLVRASAVVIAGGHHFSDYGRRTNALVMQGRIWVLSVLAMVLRKRIYLVSVGLGPFRSRLTALLAKSSCLLADDMSVRDIESMAEARRLGLSARAMLSFDMSALLTSEEAAKRPESYGKPKVLGASITPISGTHNGVEELDLAFSDCLSTALSSWLGKNPEWTLRLFVFHGKLKRQVTHDADITKRLWSQLAPSGKVTLVEYNKNPTAVMDEVAECTAFIGMKFHACLFAYLADIPLIVIPYHPKCVSLANEIGLPVDAILHPSEGMRRRLVELLDYLIGSPEAFRPRLPREIARERAKSAFDAILGSNMQ